MVRYHFHCTDGYSLVADPEGHDLPAGREEVHAAQVARAVMRRFGCLADWSDWLVAVHDEDGLQVALLPFADLRGSLGEAIAA